MNWLALFVICMNVLAIQARRYGNYNRNVRNLIDFIRRRQFDNGRYGAPVLGSPRYPQHLPQAEPVYPGHSLIRPTKGHLKSSYKYPLRDVKNTLVYGNPSNLGIMYGKENERVQYSDFRRGSSTDKLLVELAQILGKHKRKRNKSQLAAIITPQVSHSSDENNAREVLDIMDSDIHDWRRRRAPTKYRSRSNEGDTEETSSSESDEKNPGNPFTIHKTKYKQNYLWNHFMDGDHMNINPLGPEFKNRGPSGIDIFLGRKWWYFNQDDYKPMS